MFNTIISSAEEIIVIDIEQAEEKELLLSTFISKVEFVPLELKKECPIDGLMSVSVTEDYIVAVSGLKSIYLFDRKSGRYIKKISGRGEGPDEYVWVTPQIFENKRQVIYVDCFAKWRAIDVRENKCVEEIVMPEYYYKKENLYQGGILFPYHYHDSCYIGFMNNSTGKIEECAAIFTRSGRILKTLPNNQFYEKKTLESPLKGGGIYEYNKELYFYPNNDTVYKVKSDNFYPHIILKQKRDPSLIKYKTMKLSGSSYTYVESDNNISISPNFETDKYVFFNLLRGDEYSCGYYDKRTRKTSYTPFKSSKELGGGFVDDINGLKNMGIDRIQNGLVINSIDAESLVELYELGKLKLVSSEGRKLAEKVQYDDNPIIVVMTLK